MVVVVHIWTIVARSLVHVVYCAGRLVGILMMNILICIAMVRRIKKVEATLPIEYLQRVGYLQVRGRGAKNPGRRRSPVLRVVCIHVGFCAWYGGRWLWLGACGEGAAQDGAAWDAVRCGVVWCGAMRLQRARMNNFGRFDKERVSHG